MPAAPSYKLIDIVDVPQSSRFGWQCVIFPSHQLLSISALLWRPRLVRPERQLIPHQYTASQQQCLVDKRGWTAWLLGLAGSWGVSNRALRPSTDSNVCTCTKYLLRIRIQAEYPSFTHPLPILYPSSTHPQCHPLLPIILRTLHCTGSVRAYPCLPLRLLLFLALASLSPGLDKPIGPFVPGCQPLFIILPRNHSEDSSIA